MLCLERVLCPLLGRLCCGIIIPERSTKSSFKFRVGGFYERTGSKRTRGWGDVAAETCPPRGRRPRRRRG